MFQVFKHRYSLDCHQRQTHPLQRMTGRSTHSIGSPSPPKPIAEDNKRALDDVSESNLSPTSAEQEVDANKDLKEIIPTPCAVDSNHTTIGAKKERKNKSVVKKSSLDV